MSAWADIITVSLRREIETMNYVKGYLLLLTTACTFCGCVQSRNGTAVDTHSPESTVIGFTNAAAEGNAKLAQSYFLPDGADYQDIWEVLTSEPGSSRYPGRVMMESIDVNQPIEVISKVETQYGLKVVWRVTFAKGFVIQGHKIEAGTQYDFDATLKRTEERWLIDNF